MFFLLLFTAFILFIGFAVINLKYIEGQTKIYSKPHLKVTKRKSKFNFFLG